MGREDDARLVARANAGDAEALTALYRAHRDWVAALAFRFTGNEADALDVLQETFLYLYGRLPLALTAPLRGFLYPVVKHQAIGVVRRRKPQAELDEAALPWHGVADTGDFGRLLGACPPSNARWSAFASGSTSRWRRSRRRWASPSGR